MLAFRHGCIGTVRGELVTLWDRLGPLGISPSAARVHGWLLTLPDAQDAEEIADGLAMSRGAVSIACTELVEWGVILAERPAGSRRSLFRPSPTSNRSSAASCTPGNNANGTPC